MKVAFLGLLTIETEHSIFKPYRFASAEEETRKGLGATNCSLKITIRKKKNHLPLSVQKKKKKGGVGGERKPKSHIAEGRSINVSISSDGKS